VARRAQPLIAAAEAMQFLHKRLESTCEGVAIPSLHAFSIRVIRLAGLSETALQILSTDDQ